MWKHAYWHVLQAYLKVHFGAQGKCEMEGETSCVVLQVGGLEKIAASILDLKSCHIVSHQSIYKLEDLPSWLSCVVNIPLSLGCFFQETCVDKSFCSWNCPHLFVNWSFVCKTQKRQMGEEFSDTYKHFSHFPFHQPCQHSFSVLCDANRILLFYYYW